MHLFVVVVGGVIDWFTCMLATYLLHHQLVFAGSLDLAQSADRYCLLAAPRLCWLVAAPHGRAELGEYVGAMHYDCMGTSASVCVLTDHICEYDF